MQRKHWYNRMMQLVAFLVIIAFTAPAPAQIRAGTGLFPRQGASLGSTWAVGPPFRVGSDPRPRGFTFFTGRQSPGSRFFGGVSVGRGFYPYFTPPYVVGQGYTGYVNLIATRSACGGVNITSVPVPIGAYVPVTSPWFTYTPGWNYPVSPIEYYGYSGTGFSGYSGTGYSRTGPGSRVPGNNYTPGLSGVSIRDTVSRSRVNETPPVDFGRTFTRMAPSEQEESAEVQLDFSDFKPWLEAAVENSAVAGEFPAAAGSLSVVTPVDPTEALRLQARGDEAFREGDPELARTFYQAATHALPGDGTSPMRMALAHVFLHEYPRAASSVNAALTAGRFDELVWADSSTLLAPDNAELTEASESGLWQWLEQRPGSADRLLLAAAFQHFAGHSRNAADLVDLAQEAGADDNSCERLKTIIIGEHAARQQRSTIASADQAP